MHFTSPRTFNRLIGLGILLAFLAGCEQKPKDLVKEAQDRGDLQNLECIIQKDGKQFVKYIDIRNDTWVASKLYDTNLFQYGGKPKTSEVELSDTATHSRQDPSSIVWSGFFEESRDGKNLAKQNLGKIERKIMMEDIEKYIKHQNENQFCMMNPSPSQIGGRIECTMYLNVNSMQFSIDEISANGELSFDKSLKGVCRKQTEILLR